jgi:enoyl-CoA hydratase/carnithine racemase
MKSVSTETIVPTLLYEAADGVAILTLNEPKRRNVLSTATLTALKSRLAQIAQDTAVKVVVLRAEGPVFSSGHDLRELQRATPEENAAIFTLCSEVMEGVRLLPQPVIAQVQGLATAAGCQLVATCDLAVASEEAAFATPGVKIGLFCTTPGVALARAVSTKKAMEMLLTGTPISAREALERGLVNKLVPAAALTEETMALARHVAAASGNVLRIGKQAFYRQIALDRPDAYRMAEGVMCENLLEPGAKEGISAFLEKRTPRWQD